MAMSDKELKKIKKMMPSGATLAGLKNIIKGQIERKTGKAKIVSDKDVEFLKKSMPKRKKKTKTGPGSR